MEWNYVMTVSLFPYTSMEHKFKVYESAGVARTYIVAILLEKIHACLYVIKPWIISILECAQMHFYAIFYANLHMEPTPK